MAEERKEGYALFAIVTSLTFLAVVFHYYGGIYHDAILYGAQVLNRHTGELAQDLYFRFGSQDSYTLFSVILSPLLSLLDLEQLFAVVHFAARIVFIIGAAVLSKLFLEKKGYREASLIVLAVIPLYFGGLEVFQVFEPFLTPRIIANGFVLLSVYFALTNRLLNAAAFMAIAVVFHPLQSLPGIVCLFFYYTSMRYGTGRSFGLLVWASVVVLFATLKSLPRIDDTWFFVVAERNGFMFPGDWTLLDWSRIAFCLLVSTVAAKKTLPPTVSKFALGTVLWGCLGLALSNVGAESGRLLLLQGQFYRSLWLLQVVSVFSLFSLLAASKDSLPWAAPKLVALCAFLALEQGENFQTELSESIVRFLAITTAVVIVYRLQRKHTENIRVLVVATAVALFLAVAYRFSWLIAIKPSVPGEMSLDKLVFWVLTGGQNVEIFFLCGLLFLIMARAARDLRYAVFVWMLILGSASLTYYISRSDVAIAKSIAEMGRMRDRAFVNKVIEENKAEHTIRTSPSLTIYYPNEFAFLWLNLRSAVFFDIGPLTASIYSSGYARRSLRRAWEVKGFELDDFSFRAGAGAAFPYYMKLFASCREREELSQTSVEKLCSQSDLSFVVARAKVPWHRTWSNGSINVYDCSMSKDRLGEDEEPVSLICDFPLSIREK